MATAAKMTGRIWAVAISLLLAPVSSSQLRDEDLLPHFDFNARSSFLLPNSQPWVPSKTTVVTFGRADVPMQIHLGNNSGGEDSLYSKSKSCHLMFKCSSKDSDFQEIALVSSSVGQHVYQTDQFCGGRRQFKLQKVNSSVHALTLGKATNISFGQSLRHLMEFRVRVEFPANNLSSSSLFIYSTGAVMNINSVPTTSGGYSYTRFFLTEDAIQFLTGRTKPTAEPLMRVNFLEKQYLDLLRNSSTLVRTVQAVTVTMSAIKPCVASTCDTYDTVIFTTESIEAYSVNKSFKASISFQSGAIYVGRQVYLAMNSLIGNRVRVTLEVSPNRLIRLGDTIYSLRKTVMEFTHVNRYANSSYPSKCFIESSGAQESLTLFLGGKTLVTLDCPLVCSDRAAVCSVYRDGSLCNDMGVNTSLLEVLGLPLGGSVSCGGVGQVTRRGRLVVFDYANLSSRLLTITFARRLQNFTYKFSIAQMPMFSDVNVPSSQLPPVTYANLDMRVEFTCKVWHSHLDYVSMSAYVQVLLKDSADQSVRWSDATLRNFAIYSLKLSPNVVVETTTTNALQYEHTLHVVLPHVTEDWRFLQFDFVCQANLSDKDANTVLGLPRYQTESRTRVVYAGKRLPLGKAASMAAAMPGKQLALLLLLLMLLTVG